MTVRDFIQEILLNCPNLDSEVYVQTVLNSGEPLCNYEIVKIDNDGTNDTIFIEIKQ